MDELADSAALAGDPDGLRRRLAEDGYLFFRGLLPAGELRAAGLAVLARLRAGGWVDDRGIPSIQPLAVNSMDALTDPAFRAASSALLIAKRLRALDLRHGYADLRIILAERTKPTAPDHSCVSKPHLSFSAIACLTGLAKVGKLLRKANKLLLRTSRRLVRYSDSLRVVR